MNPTSTLFAGLGVTQVADIITWLSTWPVHAPPQNVSLAVAALVVTGAHVAANWWQSQAKAGPAPVASGGGGGVTATTAPAA